MMPQSNILLHVTLILYIIGYKINRVMPVLLLQMFIIFEGNLTNSADIYKAEESFILGVLAGAGDDGSLCPGLLLFANIGKEFRIARGDPLVPQWETTYNWVYYMYIRPRDPNWLYCIHETPKRNASSLLQEPDLGCSQGELRSGSVTLIPLTGESWGRNKGHEQHSSGF